MLTALSTALSALNAQSTAIDVVGNNLANLNTVGFKSTSTDFYDLVSQTIGEGGETQIGMGVATPITQRIFSQGSIQSSSGALDVAIQGSGFLVVKDPTGATLYTRAGDLKTDSSGNLTDATGAAVQGWTAVNGVVNSASPLGSITVPQGTLKPPTATQNLSLTANLDSRSTPVSTSAQTPNNVAFSTAVEVYDSLGNAHQLGLNFWNNGPASGGGSQWSWQATLPGSDVGSTSSTVQVGTGTLNFDSNGHLTNSASAVPQISISGLADSASNMKVNFNLYQGNTPLITQFAQTSAQAADPQDGSPAVQLTHVGIGTGGTVLATYSNGQQLVMGQVAMASFVNPETLLAVGNNAYQPTGATSNPSIGLPNTGGRGQIVGSSLESSTVDIATEFTNLMVDQRGYQANSKVITTADQINQDTIDLIR
jgi:flagellar hook protein FlgE